MNEYGFLQFSIATITVFVGFLNQLVKNISKQVLHKDVNRYLPIFSIVFGVALAVFGYFVPNVDMGNNIIEAIFIGLSSGAAATGIHQIYKQNSKQDSAEDTELNEDEVVDESMDNDTGEISDTSTEEENNAVEYTDNE